MNEELLNQLLAGHDECVTWQDTIPRFELVTFKSDDMRGAIGGTPFRKFESVPQTKESKRKQNDSPNFDPYVDTVFDYPSIVKRVRSSSEDAIQHFNWHLTVQVPYCRMDCWHCYNPKTVCQTGIGNIRKVEGGTKAYTATDILKEFRTLRKEGQARGEHYNVLRVSGGEPFLVPELIAELLDAISNSPHPDDPKAIWTETNLTTWATVTGGESLVSRIAKGYLERTNKDIATILRTHAERLVVHPCFHGLSDDNLAHCTGIQPGLLSFKDLVDGFRALHGLQLHLYPTIISEASDPDYVEELFAELYNISPVYPLKLALISVDYYPPVAERFRARAQQVSVFSRFACQARWQKLLKRYYGVSYSQIPRPFVEGMSAFPKPTEDAAVRDSGCAKYDPLLILLKSDIRPEYRQELLTILAAPVGTRIRESYDVKHVEPTLLGRLCVETESFCQFTPNVLLSFTNKQKSFTCIPIRQAKLIRIDRTESLMSFELILGPYLVPHTDGGVSGTTSDFEEVIQAFGRRMSDYFGVTHTWGKAGKSAWVFLGESALLSGWDLKRGFSPVGQNGGDGWGTVLNMLTSSKGASHFLDERNVFIRLLPIFPETASGDNVPVSSCEVNAGSPVKLHEGDKRAYRVTFSIPRFEKYQGDQDRDRLLSGRTLRISSSTPSLVVEGYQARPLPKYGDFEFVVRCSRLENDIPAKVVIEAEDQSCFCPRIQLEFLLKKENPSEC